MGILKEKTRILVTHAIDYIHLADRIIIMDKGKIVECGPLEDLLDNPIVRKLMEINDLNNTITVSENQKSVSDFSSIV